MNRLCFRAITLTFVVSRRAEWSRGLFYINLVPNPVKDALHYGNQLKKINILDKELSTQKYEI